MGSPGVAPYGPPKHAKAGFASRPWMTAFGPRYSRHISQGASLIDTDFEEPDAGAATNSQKPVVDLEIVVPFVGEAPPVPVVDPLEVIPGVGNELAPAAGRLEPVIDSLPGFRRICTRHDAPLPLAFAQAGESWPGPGRDAIHDASPPQPWKEAVPPQHLSPREALPRWAAASPPRRKPTGRGRIAWRGRPHRRRRGAARRCSPRRSGARPRR